MISCTSDSGYTKLLNNTEDIKKDRFPKGTALFYQAMLSNASAHQTMP